MCAALFHALDVMDTITLLIYALSKTFLDGTHPLLARHGARRLLRCSRALLAALLPLPLLLVAAL